MPPPPAIRSGAAATARVRLVHPVHLSGVAALALLSVGLLSISACSSSDTPAGDSAAPRSDSGATTPRDARTSSQRDGLLSTDALAPVCRPILEAYAAAVDEARACDPKMSTVQCVALIDDQLACPCPVDADRRNSAAFDEMERLKGQWRQNACAEGVVCSTVTCAAPRKNNCRSVSGNQGRCAD